MKEANGKRTIFASKETYVGKIIEKETEMEKCVEKRNGEKNEEKEKRRERQQRTPHQAAAVNLVCRTGTGRGSHGVVSIFLKPLQATWQPPQEKGDKKRALGRKEH